MSIVRRYRDTAAEDGSRLFEYREAWCAPGSGEVVVHHGRVGQPGTVTEERVADDAAGEELLEAFAAQCAVDGFTELEESALAELVVAYRLRGRAATDIERRHGETLAGEITHQLAWRGLGEVVETAEAEGRLELLVRTPHAGRAMKEIPVAARRAHGIQPNKIEVLKDRTASADAGKDA